MTYGYVYVAQIAMGADFNQTVKAIAEAEAYPGPSLIIAYAPCINHGIKKGMSKAQTEEKLAVDCGYWNNFRFNPAAEKGSKFTLDSKQPKEEDYQAFLDGDGSASTSTELSDEFLSSVMDATSSRPLYWPLQEFIYANGELKTPIRWAAQRVRCEHPEFAGDIRPLNFTGEAMFPWMFEQERALRPFKPAMDVLMEDTHFGTIYDADQLARNEVPLQAAVYFDDMYVDSGLQLDTLSRVGRSHYWTTNEFEHDGVHGSVVFKRLFNEALNRGDLEELF